MDRIETEHGIFTSNPRTWPTAQEVYEEWLVNKNLPPQPSDKERIAELEQIINMILMGDM